MSFWARIALLFIIPAASATSVFISPELKQIQQYFQLPATEISKVMSCYLLGYLAGQFIFAKISKKIGIKFTIQLGIVLAILSLLIQIASWDSHNYLLFVFSRFLAAFGLSSGIVCGFAAIKESMKNEAEKNFLSIITVAFTISMYLSIFISGNLIRYFSFKEILLFNLAYLGIALVLSNALEHSQRRSNIIEENVRSYKNETRYILIYAFALSLTTIFSYGYSLYGPLIAIDRYHLSPTEFGNYNFINLFGVLIGSMLFAKAAKVTSEKNLVLIALILCLIGAISYYVSMHVSFHYSLIIFMLTTFIFNIICGLLYPSATYKALQFGSCKRLSSAFMNAIKIAMPCISIFLVSYKGFDPMINLTMMMTVFASISLLMVFSINR